MTKKVAIIGFGGHTRSSLNLLLNYFGSDNISIYDESFVEGAREKINAVSLAGSVDDIELEQSVFLSIGNNALRKNLFLEFKNQILKDNVFHSNSLQEKEVTYGVSNQIFAHSYINSEVVIGDNNIINTGAIIEHQVVMGSHNHISVGVKICGRSTIGNMCLIGAGAVVPPNMIIPPQSLVVGLPAKIVREVNESETEEILERAQHYIDFANEYKNA